MAPSLIAAAALWEEEEGSVSEKNNREVVEQYVRAVFEQDFETQDRVLHAEFVSEWPQSGERVRGAANARAIGENYPGGAVKANVKAVRGAEDRCARQVGHARFNPLRDRPGAGRSGCGR